MFQEIRQSPCTRPNSHPVAFLQQFDNVGNDGDNETSKFSYDCHEESSPDKEGVLTFFRESRQRLYT